MHPSGWETKTLEEIAFVQRGKFSARPRNDPKYFGGSIPFVQTGDVSSSGKFLKGHSQTLNQEGLAVSKLFPANTILITIAANIGDSVISRYDVAFPDSVVGVQARPAYNHEWLYYALQSLKVHLDRRSTQNAQKNINLELLRPVAILTPPRHEQDRIADILSTWDGAIEITEKLLANSKIHKNALAQQLLTARQRFSSFSDHWLHLPISSISERITRRNDGSGLPILTISSTQGFVRQDEKYSRYMAGKSAEDYIALRSGEFAYNKGNSKTYEFGCIFPLEQYPEALVPHVYVCFALKPDLHAPFYQQLFEADYLRPQLKRIVKTGVRNNGLLNITPTEFLETAVPVPSVEEQKAIADTLITASKTIEVVSAKLEKLKAEKAALMQQLLTGKRRVSTKKEAA